MCWVHIFDCIDFQEVLYLIFDVVVIELISHACSIICKSRRRGHGNYIKLFGPNHNEIYPKQYYNSKKPLLYCLLIMEWKHWPTCKTLKVMWTMFAMSFGPSFSSYKSKIIPRLQLTFHILPRYKDFIRVVLLEDIQFAVFPTQLLQNTSNLGPGIFL